MKAKITGSPVQKKQHRYIIISDILFLKPNQGRSKLDSVWDQIWAPMKSENLTSFGFSPPFVGLKNLQLYLNRVNWRFKHVPGINSPLILALEASPFNTLPIIRETLCSQWRCRLAHSSCTPLALNKPGGSGSDFGAQNRMVSHCRLKICGWRVCNVKTLVPSIINLNSSGQNS